jgi:hypothetical protein
MERAVEVMQSGRGKLENKREDGSGQRREHCVHEGRKTTVKQGTSVLERRPQKGARERREPSGKRERVLRGSFQQLASDS